MEHPLFYQFSQLSRAILAGESRFTNELSNSNKWPILWRNVIPNFYILLLMLLPFWIEIKQENNEFLTDHISKIFHGTQPPVVCHFARISPPKKVQPIFFHRVTSHKKHHKKNHIVMIQSESSLKEKPQQDLPETNTAPDRMPSQKETSLPTIHFQVLC